MQFIIALILTLSFATSVQQEFEKFTKPFDTSFIQIGEELVYEVKYLFFKLGQIKFKVMDKFIDNGKEFYKVKVRIDSYAFPFIDDIHADFEAVFDSKFIAREYHSELREGKYYQSVKYKLVESYPAYIVEKSYHDFKNNTRGIKIDTVKISTMYCDGPSLFYYARSNAYLNKTVILPTFIEGVKGITLINFGNKKTKVKVEAMDESVDAYEINGKANYIGLFGLTGDFVGWISADERAIPLKGKLKVLLGSVVVELKSLNGNWKQSQK